ncbi:hypothetical protein [Salinibacillus kushneri]|uniref:hypothetical protein n=1 Tax=Salinibacillus kushneri TaxID=237682 RepID=UPI001C657E80|nr:hypothetical protein [Salinibacillus kushneri]
MELANNGIKKISFITENQMKQLLAEADFSDITRVITLTYIMVNRSQTQMNLKKGYNK